MTVPGMEGVRGERYERSQVLVLSAAFQLHHVYRDRTSDHKTGIINQCKRVMSGTDRGEYHETIQTQG